MSSTTYVAAYALASLAKPQPTAADVEAICKSVGVAVDKDALAFTLEAIGSRSVQELIAEGAVKMSQLAAASAPAAGGAAPAAAAAAPAAAAGGKKKEEPEEEDDDEMGFGLFD